MREEIGVVGHDRRQLLGTQRGVAGEAEPLWVQARHSGLPPYRLIARNPARGNFPGSFQPDQRRSVTSQAQVETVTILSALEEIEGGGHLSCRQGDEIGREDIAQGG